MTCLQKAFPAYVLIIGFHENIVTRMYITDKCNLLCYINYSSSNLLHYTSSRRIKKVATCKYSYTRRSTGIIMSSLLPLFGLLFSVTCTWPGLTMTKKTIKFSIAGTFKICSVVFSKQSS